jgi:hypothetical protein
MDGKEMKLPLVGGPHVAGRRNACGRGGGARGSPQNLQRRYAKKEASLEFPLLCVGIKFTSGVQMKTISTWTLVREKELYYELVSKQLEVVSAK